MKTFLAKARYCTGHERSRPHSVRMRVEVLGAGAGLGKQGHRVAGQPDHQKIVRLRMNRVISA